MATATPYSAFAFDTVCSVTISAVPTDGAAIVAFEIPTADTVTSVVDNGSGSPAYTLDHSRATINGTATRYVYRRNNIDNAPTAIEVTVSATASLNVSVLVVEGMTTGTATPTPTSQPDTAYSATTHTASFTTTAANDIAFITWSATSGDNTTTGTSGWAILPGPTTAGSNDRDAYNVDCGAAGAKTADFSTTGSERRFSILAYPVAGGGGPTVSTVSSNSATEASPIVHTVTLSGATSGTTNFAATLVGVTATGSGTDFTSALGSATYSNGVTFSAGNMVVPDAVSSYTVSVPTTSDTLDEVNETYTLTVGGVSGTGTITDDDAEPSITGTTSVTVDAGDPTVITYTLSAVSGRTITRTLTVTDGTATGGGVDYTSTIDDTMFATTSGSGTVTISGSTVTIPAGVGAFTLTIPTTA
jgi:hypothetical protein